MLKRLAIVLFVALAACGHAESKSTSSDDDDRGGSAKQQQLVLVAVGPAPPHWTDAIPARDRVRRDAHVAHRLAARRPRVRRCMVERGQHVKIGDAAVHGDERRTSPSSTPRATRPRSSSTPRRPTSIAIKALVDVGSLPEKELVSAEQDLREASVAVRHREPEARVAQGRPAAARRAFTITAPRDGVVVEKNVAVGQQVVDPTPAR